MNLDEVTWPEVADLDTSLAVIPVGSTEQHGPHAPLSTDTITASTIAARGIDEYDGEALKTPAIPVGVSAEHRQFPGTLTVTPATLRSVLGDVIKSLASHEFDRIVLVNGHGGNVDAVSEVAAKQSRNGVAYVVPFTWFDAVEASIGHAGPVETSVLQYAAPESLRAEELPASGEGAADRWGDWVGSVNLAHDAIEFTENGVVGDPRDATPEDGEAYVEMAAAALATVLTHVKTRRWNPETEAWGRD